MKVEDAKPDCKNCEIRKYYAVAFDIHFSKEDCPYDCESEEQKKKNDKKEVEKE